MKFAICNLGCKVNNYEANWYRQQLAEKYEETDFKNFSDIYIINTCTVTNMAGSKSRQMIHKARKMNKDSCIVAVGCYVQTEKNDLSVFDDCDIVIGSKYKTLLPQLIDDYFINKKKIFMVEDFQTTPFEEMFIRNFNQVRAYLKIQDGCNQFCSYCVIPFARGRERCLSLPLVLKQARQLVDSGHPELVLTGIHTGRWHDGEYDLADLIETILKEVKNLQRIRISSIEVTEVSNKLIDLIAENSKIAHHLHIPLQTGSDTLLKDNNRPYDTAYYYDKIQKIRKRIPDISISSDVIVGLPNETEAYFRQTEQFINKCQLSFLHVFPYARKKYTADYYKKEQVEENVKHQRVGSLTKLSTQLYNTYAGIFIGKEVEVLFEKKEDDFYVGHCSQYLVVKVKSEADITNQMGKVFVEKNEGEVLFGNLI
ncbi:MAG: tRNA (N(6)-L-threonylcarbamoyladenosine(37)-C(2))-methylthiotransferase MtaB [Erysipelotrichia bacterium]|nr:tRNA (N(6)-L-threonylcarbamoyladenosine(37)-C(2))-methylthiotransferase MtaB [Erysipelotrichia bacterium]